MIPLALCVTMGVAMAMGAWGVSMSINNHQMTNVTTTIEDNEDIIRNLITVDADQNVTIAEIKKDIGHIKGRVDDIFDLVSTEK